MTRPACAGTSTLAKIRNLQKRLQQNKNRAAAAASTSALSRRTPDGEAFLEAVLPPDNAQGISREIPTVEDGDAEDRAAVAKFRRQKNMFEDLKRQNGGHLPFRQDVEWMKVQAAEDARKKKRKQDELRAMEERDESADPSLFPGPLNANNLNFDDSDDGLHQFSQGSRRQSELPRSETPRMTMQEAELLSMRVALDAEKDGPRKKRKAPDSSQEGSASGPSKAKGSRSKVAKSQKAKAKAPGKASGKPRQTAKSKRKKQDAVRQMTSLFTSNVFEQQANEDAAEQPTFRSRRKNDALKELIASVPAGDKKAARSDMGSLLAATKDFTGRGSVKADNGMWLVKGMKTSLKAYQLLGSAFMRRRENAAEEPRGGLMADQMGLGKTLMMLANIVNGRPPKGAKDRATLLIASPALLTQWGREIETHTDGTLQVMTYRTGTRIDSNQVFNILNQHDIILTTYSEIMRSYPKNEPPIACQTAEEKIAWWKKVYDTERGILHRMFFHRVVLDEAQAIKNHTSRTSIACRALMANHRWAISGTPVLNGLTELYPYFKFLRVPHTGSFKIFKHNYCGTSETENTERLLVRLSQFMIRRTHADIMFGAPILKLPKADQSTYWCDFNSVERNIYDIVRERFSKRINVIAKAGELERSYSNVLVMLLRLRQLAAHVLMLQFVMKDLLEREDIERIRQVVKDQSSDTNTRAGKTIIAIRRQLQIQEAEEKKRTASKGKAPQAQDEEEASVADEADAEENVEEEPEPGRASKRVDSGGDFGKIYNFKSHLNSLTTGDQWEKLKEKARCNLCDRRPITPWLTSCKHIYCQTCYEQLVAEGAEQEREGGICKNCGSRFRYAHPCDPDGNAEGSADYSGPETRGKKSKKKRTSVGEEVIEDDWLSLGGEVLPSAKTIAIKAQILNWVRENKDVKIIIYTQFLAMIKILAKVCQEEGWRTEQYHGKVGLNARDKAISTFAENPDVRVLLASLRCGGLGLNLTMASRVIVVDPWWNSASEQQAFCRIFRIGQTSTTFMTRLCVKNTVDQRLIDMQERKKKEIDEVMEDDGSTVGKMTIRDLMRLFGNLQDDENGKPFIVVDNPDPRGGFRADRHDEGYADEI
ncbi:SNF2 family N-terminal domain-containing protein [Massariosphaeria phaeospora]|uniref:SNF2 family N-terminal domain-containing protein n=1 Tax=Massariosphaeria phaeospora TaxID=100035 RepID=A0A7C8IGM0_9PLEO|nr:SNF2 family N-terminal domain-containing protein [Massariosphaeria phaeospora]